MVIVKKIFCIYNAEGTLKGELKYIYDKMFKNINCSMCEITHNTFTFKKKWNKKCLDFIFEIECLHLDELSNNIKEIVNGKTPCVVVQTDSIYEILIKDNELLEINGDVDCFFDELVTKIKMYSQ